MKSKAPVCALIISDVVGDNNDIAWDVLLFKYVSGCNRCLESMASKCPPKIREHLEKGNVEKLSNQNLVILGSDMLVRL